MAKEPFHFYTRLNLTYLTTRKARNVKELAQGIRECSSAGIYHHTHRFLQQHEYLSPEPPNDFAYWITNVLQDNILGERIASIDLLEFSCLEDIRSNISEILEQTIQEGFYQERNVPPGQEFCFMEAQTFTLPMGLFARDLREFQECLQQVSVRSIYYHMFEARLRLGHRSNDFSIWLQDSLGEDELADRFTRLDPYTQTLQNLRQVLVQLIAERLEVLEGG